MVKKVSLINVHAFVVLTMLFSHVFTF